MISRYIMIIAVGLLLAVGQAHAWENDWSQRQSLQRLRGECQAGDRRACVPYGIKLGEYRQRREEQRRIQPDDNRWRDYRDYPGWQQR